jgi:CRP-like cAMP-binding protein
VATKADKLVEKGRALERKGNARKAWKLYVDACDLARYDPEVWLARARAAEACGESGDALEAYFYVADLYVRGGMPSEAAKMAQRVLELDPKHGGARRFVALLESRLATARPGSESGRGAAVTPPEPEPEAEPEPESGRRGGIEVALEMQADEPDSSRTSPVVASSFDELPEAIPEVLDRARTDSGAVARPVARGRSAPYRAEYRVGRTTGDIALDELKLGEVLQSRRARPETGEIEIIIDDEDDVDVVQAVAATITASPLLSELDSDLVRQLVEVGRLVHVAPDELVFAEGDPGTSLYLVLKGSVSVEKEDGGIVHRLAVLKPGAFFGEMALLTSGSRSASVRARELVDLLEVAREDVRRLVDKDGRVLKLLMRFFRARLVGTLMATSPMFEQFTRDERRDLIARFRLREMRAGHLVIKQGERAEGLYVVLMGHMQVFTGGAISDPKVLGTLGPGDVFGEMSLLDGTAAMANVRTQGRSWVLLLPRDDFAELISMHPTMLEELSRVAERRRAQNAEQLARGVSPEGGQSVKPV